MTAPAKTKKPIDTTVGLSTGSTLLNLALTGNPKRGYIPGKFFFIVGDSSSGKTFFNMTTYAEACKNPAFAKYRLIYDNVEDGMLMDVDHLFGTAMGDRLEPPALDEDSGEPVYSTTIEEFYYHVDDACKAGKPFIYVLDSMDGLSSEAEGEKFKDQKKAHRAGKEVPGSYGDGKAKKNSSALRMLVNKLRVSGSILIIISQTRDVLNASPWEEKKTRSGGRALRFYATAEFWLSLAGAIKKNIRKKNRNIGNKVMIKVKKNRITGRLPEIKTAIYPSYGVDDIGSCIDYLLEEQWWKKRGGKINAGEFGLLSREKLIRVIEGGKMAKLQKEVLACWTEIEQSGALKRKPRYS